MRYTKLAVVVLLSFAVVSLAAVVDRIRYPVDGTWNVNCNDFWGTCNIPTKHHLGEDVPRAAGTAVYAPANGIVRHNKVRTSYGNVVIIESQLPSGEVICFVMGHLRSAGLAVSVGQSVTAGQLLGYLGTSAQNGGWSPHIHLGVHKGAYAGDNATTCNGEWIYGGYTSCSSVKSDWYDPSDFITAFTATPPTNTNFPGTRAFPLGAGSGWGLAFVNADTRCGGSLTIGFPQWFAGWEQGFVTQATYTYQDGHANAVIHDQNGANNFAFPVTGRFADAYKSAGGIAGAFGPPITCAYVGSDGRSHQEFRGGYMIDIGTGVATTLWSGGTIGAGTGRPAGFEIPYFQESGALSLGGPIATTYVPDVGLVAQDFSGNGTGVVTVVARSDLWQGFVLREPIRSWWLASGRAVAGEPLSATFAAATSTKQFFRNGVAQVTGGAVQFTPTARNFAPLEGQPLAAQMYASDAYNKNGGVVLFGMGSQPQVSGNCVLQEYPSGAYTGGAMLVYCSEGQRPANLIVSDMAAYWKSGGGLGGTLGKPISNSYQIPGALRQDFEGGFLTWSDRVRQSSWPAGAVGQNTAYPYAFQQQWQMTGAGRLGNPTNAAHWWNSNMATVVVQDFCDTLASCGGPITYSHDQNNGAPIAFELRGAHRTAYKEAGGPTGFLGNVISNEMVVGGAAIQFFEHGYITYDPSAAKSRGFTW